MPWGSDKYVIMALWRLGFHEERFICFPEMDLKGLTSRIEYCLPYLSRVQRTVSGNLCRLSRWSLLWSLCSMIPFFFASPQHHIYSTVGRVGIRNLMNGSKIGCLVL